MKDNDNLANKDNINEDYIQLLEKRLRNLETEKQLFDAERLRLEENLNNYKNEVDRLRESPLVAAVIVSVNEEKGRAKTHAAKAYGTTRKNIDEAALIVIFQHLLIKTL